MTSLCRRQWLKAASLAVATAAPLWLPRSARSQSALTDYPFTLGVASGSPTPDGVVLWTRLVNAGVRVRFSAR